VVGDVQFERVVGDVDEVNLGFLIHPDNADSVRVAERCGFTLEGRIRQGWFHRGSWHDVLVYGL
jgi:RimJ/RimL family protein N-acetyltransferase